MPPFLACSLEPNAHSITMPIATKQFLEGLADLQNEGSPRLRKKRAPRSTGGVVEVTEGRPPIAGDRARDGLRKSTRQSTNAILRTEQKVGKWANVRREEDRRGTARHGMCCQACAESRLADDTIDDEGPNSA
ncbi:hypothetical protein HAX54_021406 [Datura stramonium]|uniref:Uncharacterized protein n=1 Tax=Datura stramonium TaxID=4076 RepID=A0ABS8USL7_DATST|nr:hypothetical protein [Datura stramonium]